MQRLIQSMLGPSIDTQLTDQTAILTANYALLEQWVESCNAQIAEFRQFQNRLVMVQTYFNRFAILCSDLGNPNLPRRTRILYFNLERLPSLEPYYGVETKLSMGRAFISALNETNSSAEKLKIVKGLIQRTEPALEVIQTTDPNLLNEEFAQGRRELDEMYDALEVFLGERSQMLTRMGKPIPEVIYNPLDLDFLESRLEQMVEYFETQPAEQWIITESI